MNQLVNLEKRLENALEKLKLALANKGISGVAENSDEEEEVIKESHHNINDLLKKIKELEKAATNDAKEIDKLVGELKRILETNND